MAQYTFITHTSVWEKFGIKELRDSIIDMKLLLGSQITPWSCHFVEGARELPGVSFIKPSV